METQKLKINGERLQKSLERFAYFGKTMENGVTRLALSPEDKQARDYFSSCCEQMGLAVQVDDIGNMYAVMPGETEGPPIVIGSHLDSVKKGGRFDGVLGVAAGLEVIQTLAENNWIPFVPIMVMNVTNEEGARFEPSMMASGILSGKFHKEEMFAKQDTQGVLFGEALRQIGYEGTKENRLKEAKAFLELHIEQGPVLEKEKVSIGVVECVVGMVCYEIAVTGESDHAGTTPMPMRKDALFAAMDLTAEARKKLDALDKQLVYTIGRINVFPNIHTVIPNKVVFSLEARHASPDVIRQVEQIINSMITSSEKQNCTVSAKKLWGRDTVWFDPALCREFEQAAAALGYSHKRMASGAGHDAQFMASYIPSAMIFVPSVNGKSHAENELTTWEDCEKGVNVLLEAVMSLARM